jgi:mycothiol synthase
VTALVWRSTLNAQDIADVFGLLDAVTAEDGAAPLSEQVLMHLRSGGGPAARHLLARAEDPTAKSDGRLLGYGQLDVGEPGSKQRKSNEASSELVVHPEARKHGLGIKLLEALMERAGGKRLYLWSHGEHPGAVRLATRMGFKQVRTLWQMRRSLVDIPLAGPGTADTDTDELPDGVRLRPFVVGQDEAEFVRVNNAAFDWHPEQGGWTVEQLKLRQGESWWDPDGFLLAVEDAVDGNGQTRERLLGYHWTKVHEGTQHEEPIGEVYVLGVDPSARGRHLGSVLTIAGLRYLRDRGLREVMLYVEADNDAAVRVYRDLGFTHHDTDVMFVH